MSIHRATDWQPGDPLHSPGSYTNYLFNFRDDPITGLRGDAARWPNPNTHHDLGDGDELADLITWHRIQLVNQEAS